MENTLTNAQTVECFISADTASDSVQMHFTFQGKATPKKDYASVQAAKAAAQIFAFPYGGKAFAWDRFSFEGDTQIIHGQFERMQG